MSWPIPICLHCKILKVCRPRGLCWSCYYKPGVRELYEPTSIHGVYGTIGHKPHTGEPTMVELDAMIAEQLPTMPDNESEDDKREDDYKEPHAVERGRELRRNCRGLLR